jgi:hypothetical protein
VFLLASLKPSPLQVGQGRLVGMAHSQATHGSHVRLVVLQATRRALGDAPSRSLQVLAPRLGVTAAEAAARVVPTEEPWPSAGPPAAAPPPAAASPLVATRGRHGVSRAPRTRVSSRAVRVASTQARP